MPDPIRVTRAVRRCDASACDNGRVCSFCHLPSQSCTACHVCPDCTDGWVDVPVNEECPTCDGYGFDHRRSITTRHTCTDCNGSGRRLHDWATGWCVGDEVRYGFDNCSTGRIRSIGHAFGIDRENGHPDYIDPGTAALVLSDPSHRPEPMRWKQ